MSYEPLASINMQGGINASAPPLSAAAQAALSDGSWNLIVGADGLTRPIHPPTSQGANTGSRKMLPFGDTWGGIKDNGGTQGSGSFFQDIGRSRWGIGAGFPHIEGTNVSGFTLSTNLQLQILIGGVPQTPVAAGLAQPSAPSIGIIESTGNISNSMSAKIERTRPATGARSLASPTSAVIQPSANRIRLTFPTAVTGQTHWRAYFTFQGFGGTGIHYLYAYSSTSADIPESVVAASSVDGIARSIDFNFQDGDLLPIEASYDDYVPPAATHAVRIENVVALGGCYADSSSSPTTTNTGVAIAISKQNNYESYIPTHLCYLPEPIVDVLARQMDDYAYFACQNSIQALQYVGDRGDELPPTTITTILPDIGIQYATNWCQFRGRLAIYTAQGNLLVMDEQGNWDPDFAAPVAKILKTFGTSGTAVGYDPTNDCLVVGNGKRLLVGSFHTGDWRQVWLPDLGVSGTVLSMTTSRRTLYVSLTSGTVDAYSWDSGSASIVPVSVVSNYQNGPGGNSAVKDIYEMAISTESGDATAHLAVCIAKNRAKAVFRQISVTNASATVVDADASFSANMVGKRVLLFGAIESGGAQLFHGVVDTYTDTSHISLKNLAGAAMNPSGSKTDLLMFVGEFTDDNVIADNPPNFFPYLTEARSYQVAVWMRGASDLGNVLSADLFGSAYPASRAL